MIITDAIISDMPFKVRRRIRWGDCDPAGVVYTPVFGEYVIATAELFYDSVLRDSPQRRKSVLGFGTPTRALDFDFRISLRPDEEIDITVDVVEIRERTFRLRFTARNQEGHIAFIAHLVPVCVPRTERRSIPVPDELRAALIKYQTQLASEGAPA